MSPSQPLSPVRLPAHRARLWRWFDRLLTLGLLVPSALLLLATGEPVWLLVTVAQIVPLWWRRSHPTEVFAAVAFASACQVLVSDGPLPGQLAFPIAAYSAARWSPASTKVVVLAVSMCAAVVAGWDWSVYVVGYRSRLLAMLAPTISSAGIAGTAWALGLAASQRDRTLAALVERAEYLERMAERDVALAAQDERARIAREMHDVVAHGLSVIVVQADGARYAAAKDPEVAVETLETIADTGRSSLAEMRRLLGLLRTDHSGVRPQPSLTDVQHLVEEARAGGMHVEAHLPEPWPSVPEGVGLAAYRVVQEALTNVRKHAGPSARVRMLVSVSDEVRIRVVDDGRGAASNPADAGLGLVGMRERVGVHGGRVHARPAPGGGWVVDARIPW